MKQIIMIAALLTNVMAYGQNADSVIIPKTGIMYMDTTPKQVHHIIADTMTDSGRMVYRDTAYIRYDTFYSNAFVPIKYYQLMDWPTPASAITLSLEEGDFASYVIVRYTLWGFPGVQLYSNRLRIAGSCYQYFKMAGVEYIYWKVCHEKGFEPINN